MPSLRKSGYLFSAGIMYLQPMRHFYFALMVMFHLTAFTQRTTDPFLKNILEKNPDAIFQQVLRDPETYRLQIVYTEINRNKHNRPTFKNYYYNYDPDFYFNPASTVKMPLAFLSLEKLNKMQVKGVNKY